MVENDDVSAVRLPAPMPAPQPVSRRSALVRLGCAAAATLALATAALAAAAVDDPKAMEALIAAAKKEGELVIYSSESDKQVADTTKAFEAKVPIDLIELYWKSTHGNQ